MLVYLSSATSSVLSADDLSPPTRSQAPRCRAVTRPVVIMWGTRRITVTVTFQGTAASPSSDTGGQTDRNLLMQ